MIKIIAGDVITVETSNECIPYTNHRSKNHYSKFYCNGKYLEIFFQGMPLNDNDTIIKDETITALKVI